MKALLVINMQEVIVGNWVQSLYKVIRLLEVT